MDLCRRHLRVAHRDRRARPCDYHRPNRCSESDICQRGHRYWRNRLVGRCIYSGASFPFTGPTGLTINGYPFLGGQGAPNGYTINGVSASLYAILADVPNLTPNEFFLDSSYGSVVGGSPDGIPGVSGTVSCVSGCGVSAVPIPAASPLFGSALLALAGLAAYRSRRTRRG